MGKCTKKGKITGDVAIMEVSQASSLGVRTRASTLALQRLHASSPPEPAFLELRSRKLEKLPLLSSSPEPHPMPPSEAECDSSPRENPNLGTKTSSEFWSMNSRSFGTGSGEIEKLGCAGGDEASVVDNNLEFQERGSRSRRGESAPYNRVQIAMHEIEEFFAYAEQQQQQLFMNKYNFDIVNDVPLPGRYEWVSVSP